MIWIWHESTVIVFLGLALKRSLRTHSTSTRRNLNARNLAAGFHPTAVSCCLPRDIVACLSEKFFSRWCGLRRKPSSTVVFTLVVTCLLVGSFANLF